MINKVVIEYIQFIFIFLNPIGLFFIVLAIIRSIKKCKEYKQSSYYQSTHLPFSYVKNNKGRFGEYTVYGILKKYEADGAKLLFNLYIPNLNGGTSEIDVLMISKQGIFVIESKNFNGWIFGNEKQRNWCQTLPVKFGESFKSFFYNPILQNRSHIKCLKSLIGEQIPMKSIIVFGDNCVFKELKITDNDYYITNYSHLSMLVSYLYLKSSEKCLNDRELSQIYNKLYSYCNVNNEIKNQHISDVQEYINR